MMHAKPGPGRTHLRAVVAALAILASAAAQASTTLTFQQGVGGYSGTVDTYLRQASATTSFSAATLVEWDGEDGGGSNFLLLRFDDIFGTSAGQIAPGDTITSATLSYEVVNTGNAATVNEIAIPWSETDTYNTFGGDPGVQADEYGTAVGSATGSALGARTVDVTPSLIAWNNTPSANRGWIFRPTGGTDGVEVRSREDATPSLRPRLTVVVNGGSPQRVLTVKHQPYLQLGNAPLKNTGPNIGTTDQVVIVWQTVESGSGIVPDDYFEVEYRAVGAPGFTPAGPVDVLNTGSNTRLNHSVTISGLPYDASFEYRVTHKRSPAAPVVVNTYAGVFRTRRPPESPASFTFAAHGDSATIHSTTELSQFESVNSRITSSASEFVLLLGDNVYDSGTHDELDARFDASRVPVNSAYLRNHIEYFCMGNHDAGTSAGQPSLDNYYVPIPALGITSPVAPAAGETAEKNYSFDYGLVHFTVIDSTAWGGPGVSTSRQAAIVNWMAADLGATSQPWKIVAAHHPPKSYFGHSDTGEGMAAEVMPVLVQQGADLLLVGHSHDYQRSFPITGHSGGDVTYILDQSGIYTKGSQVIQVLAGTGGRNIDCCAPASATQWLAKAFGSNNGGVVGPLIIDVAQGQLRVRYVGAVSGAIMDEFVVVPPGPMIRLSTAAIDRTVFVGDSLPDASFTVSNSGTGVIHYTVAAAAPWLTPAPTSGDSTSEADVITLTFGGVPALPIGEHTATITVSAPEAINSPRSIDVTVVVQSVKPDFDHDGDVDQTDFGHFQLCISGSFAQNDPACQDARLDADSDVDSADFDVFASCLSGAGIMPARDCAG